MATARLRLSAKLTKPDARRAARRRMRSSLPPRCVWIRRPFMDVNDQPGALSRIWLSSTGPFRDQHACTGMIGIEIEHFLEGVSGLVRQSETEVGESLEVPAVRPVAAREIVVEEQHRRQRGGKEIDLHLGLSLMSGGVAQVHEQPRGRPLVTLTA